MFDHRAIGSMRLLAAISLLLLASLSPASAQDGDDAAIRDVIETFRTAIIAKDGAALARLPFNPNISFVYAVEEKTLANLRKRRREARRAVAGSYGEFVAEIVSNKAMQEERFSNIRIISDGSIASVTFDYDFREDGVVTNSGLESCGMVHADDGWKISSISYSIAVPETP